MGLPANKWYVKKAVLKLDVKGCSSVKGSLQSSQQGTGTGAAA